MPESNHNNKSRIDEYIENNDCQINESVPVIIKGEKITTKFINNL